MNSQNACRDFVLCLTDFTEGLLPRNQQRLLERHQEACPSCGSLLADIQGLPELVRRADATEAELRPLASRALANAMQRLSAARPVRLSALPEAVTQVLSGPMDLPLRLMAQVHESFLRGAIPNHAPFLPADVLAQLPPMEAWRWTRRNGIRRALLAKDPATGQRLSIMFAPPQSQVPAHRHLGSESLLVLHGDMEDGDRCLSDGQWLHLERGSAHAPCMLSRGCWCLVRDEGSIRYTPAKSA